MSSGTGRKGKTFQDRELAATVRSLALTKIKVILSKDEKKMNEREREIHDELLLRMSTSLLPRLNAGRDDNEQLFPTPLCGGTAE